MQDHKKETNEQRIEENLKDLEYPASEDILNSSSNMTRIDMDVDNIARTSTGLKTGAPSEAQVPNSDLVERLVSDQADDELGIVAGTDADVTKDDLLALGPIDRDNDMGDDEELENKGFPLGLSGDDLDVPGEELDDSDEEIGEEDEENNYYSLGGDSKESLDEDASGAEV
jgi:hypothetical protein